MLVSGKFFHELSHHYYYEQGDNNRTNASVLVISNAEDDEFLKFECHDHDHAAQIARAFCANCSHPDLMACNKHVEESN